MDLTITKKTENPLLSRKEIVANIVFEGSTPKRVEVQKALAKSLKAKENMVIVQTIQTSFGHTKANVIAHAYSNEKSMKDNERANLLEKHAGHGDVPEPVVEEKKEAPAAETKDEAASSEEASEEKSE